MNKLFVLLLVIFLNACAANKDETITVTGKRISKAELEASGVKLKPAGTMGDLLNKLSSAIDEMKLPDFKRGTSKRKVKRLLKEGDFVITSETERQMIVKSKNKSYRHVTVIYTFVDDLLDQRIIR